MIASPDHSPARCRPAYVLAAVANLALAMFHGGCDQGEGSSSGARSDDAILGAWKKGGLEVSPLAVVDAKPFSAVSCRGGTVSGVDVTLCTYDSGEDATAAQDLGLATIGAATGAAIAHGPRLLVVADRKKSDPTGRTIDTIIKAFKG